MSAERTGQRISVEEPFAPPYVLAGAAFVVVGLWRDDVVTETPPGFSPLRLLNRPLGVIVGTSYEHPPRELPIRYREIIAAAVVRRGVSLMSLPFDMLLDDPTPVELGRLHYGLPKRLDPTLSVRIDERGVSVHGAETAIEAGTAGLGTRVLSLPLRLAFAAGVRLITKRLEVLGAADGPVRRARIALTPKGIGDGLRPVAATVGGRELQAMWCQSWGFTSTWLGPPHALVR